MHLFAGVQFSRYVLHLVGVAALLFLVHGAQARELTFEDALDLALRNATELQTLAAEHALAEASRKRSAQAFLPRITVDSTWLRADSSLISDIPVPAPGIPPRIVTRDLGPVEGTISSLQLEQPLINVDAWKIRKQASRGVEARRLAHRWGNELMRLEVAGRYYAVVVRQSAVKTAQMAVRASREAWELANASYEEGLVARLDVVRADAELEGNRARLMNAEADLRKARISLATLLGLEPRECLHLTSVLPLPAPPLTEDVLPGKRSDYQATEARYEAAVAGVEKARARWVPRVNLLARQQWLDVSEPLDLSSDGWLVAVNLQWTLFDGMDRQGEIAEARARKSLSRIQLEETRRKVMEEQEEAISDWRSIWSAWRASVHALESATHAATLARRQYEEGLGNMTDLLATQATLYERRLEHVRYQYRAFLASMNYYLSHGFDPLEALPENFHDAH